MVNTGQRGSTVLLFLRPANGIYLAPRVLRLSGKSTVEELTVTKKDMPNFFVEALTVSGGKVYTETREIVVPPEKRVLSVEVLPSAERYRPGEKAKVKVRVTDFAGRPFPGSAVLSVYDRSVEYVSGGSNVPEIRAFFWKWRRRHQPRTESSLDRRFGNVVKSGEATMQPLGVFGHLVADDLDDGAFGDSYREGGRPEVKMKAMARAPACLQHDDGQGNGGGGVPLADGACGRCSGSVGRGRQVRRRSVGTGGAQRVRRHRFLGPFPRHR